MKTMRENYVSPAMILVNLRPEGIICGSGDSEIPGLNNPNPYEGGQNPFGGNGNY